MYFSSIFACVCCPCSPVILSELGISTLRSEVTAQHGAFMVLSMWSVSRWTHPTCTAGPKKKKHKAQTPGDPDTVNLCYPPPLSSLRRPSFYCSLELVSQFRIHVNSTSFFVFFFCAAGGEKQTPLYFPCDCFTLSSWFLPFDEIILMFKICERGHTFMSDAQVCSRMWTCLTSFRYV